MLKNRVSLGGAAEHGYLYGGVLEARTLYIPLGGILLEQMVHSRFVNTILCRRLVQKTI